MNTLLHIISNRRMTLVLAVSSAAVVGGIALRLGTTEAAPSREASTPAAAAAAALFKNVTTQAGVDFVHVTGARDAYWLIEGIGSGGAFFDYDDDGDMDLYLVQSGVFGTDNLTYHNRLYRNNGQGAFEDATNGSNADVPGYGIGCVAADYDNDGDVDLYVTRIGSDVLLQNNGDGTFRDATAEAGLGDDGFSAGAAFLDYDRDGNLDLYVTRYVHWSPTREVECYDPNGVRDYCSPTVYDAASNDRLYHSTGDGRFEDVTGKAGIAASKGNGLGVVCSDFTGDGWVDIYVANDQTPAFFWVNQADGTFVEDAAMRGAAFSGEGLAIAGMGLVSEDLDGDADYDLVVANIQHQSHLCMRNEGGFFEDVSQAWGFGGWGVPYTAFGIGLFDQDHDGAWDLFLANGAVNRIQEPYRPGHPFAEPNQFARLGLDGRFHDMSDEAGLMDMPFGMSRGALLADYDNDGDIDVLVTNGDGRPELLRNENATRMAWTMLDLIPNTGNRNAINARVLAEAGGKRYRREVKPHAGYLASNDPRVHIGLADATVIDRVTVTWADQSVESWTQLPINRHLRMRQGASPQFESSAGAQ